MMIMIGLVGIREMTHYWVNKALIRLEVVWEIILYMQEKVMIWSEEKMETTFSSIILVRLSFLAYKFVPLLKSC